MTAYFNDKFWYWKRTNKKGCLQSWRSSGFIRESLIDLWQRGFQKYPGQLQACYFARKAFITVPIRHLNLDWLRTYCPERYMPIPIDMLDLTTYNIFVNYRNMYWPNGQKIMCRCPACAKDRRIVMLVYLSNFRCGRFFHLALRDRRAERQAIPSPRGGWTFSRCRDGYPYRSIPRQFERIGAEWEEDVNLQAKTKSIISAQGRVLILPVHERWSPIWFAAAARSIGVPSEVLPMQMQRDLAIGRKYTSSKSVFRWSVLPEAL